MNMNKKQGEKDFTFLLAFLDFSEIDKLQLVFDAIYKNGLCNLEKRNKK